MLSPERQSDGFSMSIGAFCRRDTSSASGAAGSGSGSGAGAGTAALDECCAAFIRAIVAASFLRIDIFNVVLSWERPEVRPHHLIVTTKLSRSEA